MGDEPCMVVAGDKFTDFLERLQSRRVDHPVAVKFGYFLQPGHLWWRERLALEEGRGQPFRLGMLGRAWR